MTYRSLSIQDLQQAKSLWESVFGDPAAFVDWYFETRFPPQEARGIFDHNQLLCMVQAVPYHFFLRGQRVKVIYIVGLATHPSAREQGLATRLLQNLLEEFYHQGLGMTILMPAVPLFYRRRGWEYVYTLQKSNFILPETGKHFGELEVSPNIDISLIDRLYRENFKNAHGRLERTEKDWHDLLCDHHMDGGDVFYYKDQNSRRRGYILYQATSEPVKIRELAVDDPSLIGDALLLFSRHVSNQPIEWRRWSGQNSPSIPTESFSEQTVMARIVNLKYLLETLQYPGDTILDLRFSVYDPLLKQNARTYRWRVSSGVGTLLSIPDHPSYPQFTIADLSTWVMGEPRSIPPEVEAVLPKTLNYINDLF